MRAILDGRKTQTRRVVKPSRNSQIIPLAKNNIIDWQTADKSDLDDSDVRGVEILVKYKQKQ